MPFDVSNFAPRFIDVDFPNDPNFVFGDTGINHFALRGPAYEDAVPVIPESEWRGLAEKQEADGGGNERFITRIYDQGQEGSCVANATSQAHEIVQAIQNGKDKVVHLSAISLYKRIGRSPNSGSSCDDALDEATSTGILPLDNAENRAKFGDAVMPNTGFYKAFPSNWQATAKLFRFHETYVVQSRAGLFTAAFRGEPIVVGRAGHSICYVRAVWSSGGWKFLYPNSWGDWGGPAGDFQSGFGLDSESLIRQSASWAFVVRSNVQVAA